MNAIPTAAPPPAFRFKARQPLLWAATSHSLGMVASVYLWRPTLSWIVAGLVFAASAAYFAHRRSGVGWLLALATFFLAGALHIQLRGASLHLDTSIDPYADRQELEITAHITRDAHLQDGGFNEIRQIHRRRSGTSPNIAGPNRGHPFRHPSEYLQPAPK